jgi:hypothetical protein
MSELLLNLSKQTPDMSISSESSGQLGLLEEVVGYDIDTADARPHIHTTHD